MMLLEHDAKVLLAQFGISIPDDQAENILTVGQAISYLESNAK